MKNIKKLLKKAKIIKKEDIEIELKDTKKVTIDDALDLKGERFFCEEIGVILILSDGIWYSVLIEGNFRQEIDDLYKWANNFKSYVDKNIEEIKQKQEEYFQEIKKYIDLRIQ